MNFFHESATNPAFNMIMALLLRQIAFTRFAVLRIKAKRLIEDVRLNPFTFHDRLDLLSPNEYLCI